VRAPPTALRSASDRLGAWNLYFVAKLALFALGAIDFHLAVNLAFAAGLVAMSWPRARALRPWLAVPLAVALLYYDSRMPGIARVLTSAGNIAGFSGAYLAELAGRLIDWKVLAVLAIAVALVVAAARLVRVDILVVAAMVAMAWGLSPAGPVETNVAPGSSSTKGPAAQGPDGMLADFFRAESTRKVAFAKPPGDSANFDVVFIHICSLSWDDLEASGLSKHALFASFDILLRRFNAVSTYSGPAAIRLLRAPCGQAPHRALYTPASPECLLLPRLQDAGLEAQFAMNHDGHFDNFIDAVRAQGVQGTPVSLKGIASPQHAFDGSRVYDDGAVLGRWLEARAKSPAPRAVLYYNTLSLHDGNRLDAKPGVKSSDTYKERLGKMLSDLQAFMDEIGASGRRAIVVVIPEHGAAIRGDASQIAGLREIPTPAITLVPVGIRVLGPGVQRAGDAVQIAEDTSFLAVSQIIAAMLARPPFGDSFRAGDYTANLPVTAFVSENEAVTVLKRDNAFVVRHDQEAWKALR
jgi:cellulose synthase operon protein YhjU